jgi:2-polyprenyl-3-methyl-5-hydroxy-6-metoxy-1,4-benzoquinol methylase
MALNDRGFMSILYRFLMSYAKFCGGNPSWKIWTNYIDAYIIPGSVIADVGGGRGKLANFLAAKAKWVFILDKEETSREGEDNSQYANSLTHALKTSRYQNIIPIRGNATALPFANASLEVIVCSELLEHLDHNDKELFFQECNRTLKPEGILAISTPNADYFERHKFWLPRLGRKLIPKRWEPRLPVILRGPWLKQTLEQWELKAGHYDHGCRFDHIKSSWVINFFTRD